MAEQHKTSGANGLGSIGWEVILGVISSFGLTAILIFIVGRIWTIAYFDHFGLPASGMEFTVNVFAFRSLEALIAIVVAVLVGGVAWFQQERLEKWGPLPGFLELFLAVSFGAFIVFWLGNLPPSFLATTSVLGLFGGAALGAALWLTIDVWSGPGKEEEKPGSSNSTERAAPPKTLVDARAGLLKRIGLGRASAGPRMGLVWRIIAFGLLVFVTSYHTLMKRIGLGGAHPRPWMRAAWRIVAFVMLLLVTSLYVPYLSEQLADLEAGADVNTGKFAAAILESDIDLPLAIALSDTELRKSVPVRVILTRKLNTHVLHSTDCTTIGGLEDPVSFTTVLQPDAPEVCKVITIPTSHITSIEYFQVKGRAPSNQSALQPIEIGLSEEPAVETFDSEGASDEESLRCSRSDEDKPTDFYNSVWYEIKPAVDGAALVRVETSFGEPSVGVWAAPEESIAVEPVPGSGDTRFACEIRAVLEGEQTEDENGADEDAPEAGDSQGGDEKNVVGVVANLTAGTRYLISVGAKEDRGGSGSVLVQFVPRAQYVSSMDEEMLASVEVVTDPGEVELEVWELNRDYRLAAPPAPREFSLLSDSDETVEFVSSVTSTSTSTETPSANASVAPAATTCPEENASLPQGTLVTPGTGTATPCVTPRPTSTPTSTYTPTLTPTITPALPTRADAVGPPSLYMLPEPIESGRWSLILPDASDDGSTDGFAGLVRLSTAGPNVVVTFTADSSTPFGEACAQVAVRLVIEDPPLATELSYSGSVGVDLESVAIGCADDEVELDDEFSLQIQAEGDAEVLRLAAEIIGERLRDELELDAIVGPCADACVRVSFGTDGEP